MHESRTPSAQFSVNWAELNNAVFARIYADPALLERYRAANSARAKEICSIQVDLLVSDPDEFVARFMRAEEPQ